MAKKMTFNQASKVAGQIYGSILARDSDPEGFDWCVDNLTNGNFSVREIIKEMCRSDEYREKMLMNDTPNEIARKWRKKFLGETVPNREAIKDLAIGLLENDWRDVIDGLLDSDEYIAKHGDDGIPR
ncbi:phycobilisome rod-core linker polypeptide [Methylomagnum ishizawai]|uniref:phycobilisome rod-core linker polypeptide n=1 Tax=Methylomagnum ishizawai TaxID=1760988 RepID=UPI001C336EDE|nr:phycobilisome rod-core linker polypeptide [Methylomagnum ishizawai]BBL77146.1 hypothetical protein MishRS11D_42440 [Methylomagnum ishizawai]